jgi:hypothetical protein
MSDVCLSVLYNFMRCDWSMRFMKVIFLGSHWSEKVNSQITRRGVEDKYIKACAHNKRRRQQTKLIQLLNPKRLRGFTLHRDSGGIQLGPPIINAH